MAWLGGFFLFCTVLFYRELMASAVLGVYRKSVRSAETLNLRSASGQPRQIQIHFLSELRSGFFYLPCWTGLHVFVQEGLWTRFSEEERESLLFWLVGTRLGWSVGLDLARPPDVFSRDRSAVLSGAKSLSLGSLMEKLEAFRHQKMAPFAESLLQGWSLIGPSWLSSWPSPSERLKSLGFEEAKWSLADLSPPSDSVN